VHRAGSVQPLVDAKLRAHGLEKLRVVDASIMQTIVVGNRNSSVIMIAGRQRRWHWGCNSSTMVSSIRPDMGGTAGAQMLKISTVPMVPPADHQRRRGASWTWHHSGGRRPGRGSSRGGRTCRDRIERFCA